jgi:hypothetical protein
MGSIKAASSILPLMLLAVLALTPVHASTQPSIPISGRYSVLTIKIHIPAYPKWAHDVVLNASIAWNRAQLWANSSGPAYTFVEVDDSSATTTVSYSMPQAYAGIAVGWTNYNYAPTSRTSIVSTQTFLDPSVFNEAQGSNSTAQLYAFRLALHEFGRILGLGSILDGQDLMDPRGTPERALQPPMFSTLDLYAVHVLASGSTPTFVTLPNNLQNQLVDASTFLGTGVPVPVPEFPAMPPSIVIVFLVTGFLLARRVRRAHKF